MSLLLPFPIRFPLYYSVGDDQIFLQSPSDIVDLGSDAVDTAHLLGRLSRFLRGARNLLTCYFLSPREFRRNSRKIVCLIELAHKTLIAASILPFSSFCTSSPFRFHKAAYLDLLRMLYDHRHHVDTALQDRLFKLLQPLPSCSPQAKRARASGEAPERSSVASPEGRAERLEIASMQRSLTRPHHKLATTSECDTALMPPPDKITEPATKFLSLASADSRSAQQLWDPDVVLSAPTRKRRLRNSRSEDDNRENHSPTDLEPQRSFKLRPLSRHFGIYCTGKNTMHRKSERAGRPGGTGFVIKE